MIDLSPFVPTCPQAVNAEKLNVGAVSQLSPVSQSKMRRFRRYPLCVRIWLAIQRARGSWPAPPGRAGIRDRVGSRRCRRVALAQLLQLKYQVWHSSSFCFSSSCLQVAPGYRYVVAGVLMSDKCFCPYRTPGRCGNYKGHGTPLPFCAEVISLAAAARGIGTDGDCCSKSVHRVEPLSHGSGCARWRFG